MARRVRPIAGGSESVRERIERLIAEQKISREAVDRAKAIWLERLRAGIPMPNGETVQVTLDDLYHLIVDDRVLRGPERIELALRSVFQLRQARHGRRRALSRWQEGEHNVVGFAIIEQDSRVRSMHVIEERDLRKYRSEEIIWPR